MAHRKLKVEDSEWDVWDVRPEVRAHRLGSELDNGWLCFQSGSTRRRLHPIPTGWERASDPVLVELFDQATEVAPAKKSGTAEPLANFDGVGSEIGRMPDGSSDTLEH
jgi:hypothetical protein